MSLPSLILPGQVVSADGISRLIEETRARGLGSGKVALVGQRGGGTVLARPARGLHPPPRASGGAGRAAPFDITITGTTVTFRPGTINSLLPSNYLSGVTITGTGTEYLLLNCTASNGEITAAAFAVAGTTTAAITPYAGQPPIAFGLLMGIVVDGTATKVWGDGNIQATPVEAFRIQKASPVAGQLPYDVYYTWQLSLL